MSADSIRPFDVLRSHCTISEQIAGRGILWERTEQMSKGSLAEAAAGTVAEHPFSLLSDRGEISGISNIWQLLTCVLANDCCNEMEQGQYSSCYALISEK